MNRPLRIPFMMGLMLSVGLLAGCSTGPASPPASPLASTAPSTAISLPATSPASLSLPTDMPHFDRATCAFPLFANQVEGRNVECGYVTVPERHAKLGGPLIHLAVARFNRQQGLPSPEPVIYLSGGPGGRTLTTGIGALAASFTAANDFIAFDQRGVGQTQPSLDCPEVRDELLRDFLVSMALQEQEDRYTAATLRCRDRLVRQGIDLAAYTSAENAADVADIRAAFGYTRVNLYGVSYGTYLGLAVMRDFAGIVRSAVLDSVVPMQEDIGREQASNYDRALKLLFVACGNDATCRAAYPSVQDDFTQAVARLDAQPITVNGHDPATGEDHALVITGARLVGLLHRWLYYPQTLKAIPAMLAQVKEGGAAWLTELVNSTFFADLRYSDGMRNSVSCGDFVSFESRDSATVALRDVLPEIRANYEVSTPTTIAICAQWPNTPLSPTINRAVTSDVPTLILESANDPATPPAYGRLAAVTLGKSFYIEVPGIGHGVGNSICGLTIISSFFADPGTKPATGCAAGLGVIFLAT